MVCTIATGAMLKGRIKRKQTNVFLLHKKAAIYFGTFVLGTLLYGLFLEIQHGEPVLTSTHGKLGILLLLIVIFQIIPSLVLRDRTMIRKLHMILGYSLAPLIILEASWGLYNGVIIGLKILVLIHSVSGGLTALALVWIILEILYPTEQGVVRAKIAGYLAAFLVVAGCWIAGGYNYLTNYGSQVKPIILAGLDPWAHSIVMEVKEHVFIFLPIIVIALSMTLVILDQNALLEDPEARRAIAITALLALLMVLLMFLMGAIISNAGNVRMEGLR
ncbi:MAG: hypothetical protein QG605_1695 [Euryarchaeota archaeon]|jgi:hypothetical protein|nr:hypothetical protein [Euryarchaeota archaeon]